MFKKLRNKILIKWFEVKYVRNKKLRLRYLDKAKSYVNKDFDKFEEYTDKAFDCVDEMEMLSNRINKIVYGE